LKASCVEDSRHSRGVKDSWGAYKNGFVQILPVKLDLILIPRGGGKGLIKGGLTILVTGRVFGGVLPGIFPRGVLGDIGEKGF